MRKKGDQELSHTGGCVGGKASSTFGTPIFVRVIRDLVYLDLLDRAAAQVFYNRYEGSMPDKEREEFVEKYAVEVDPKKRPDPKKDGEKTSSHDDPNVNVPKDPDKGTEPFEKKPEGE